MYYELLFGVRHVGIIIFIFEGRKMRLRGFKGVMRDHTLGKVDRGLLFTFGGLSSPAGDPHPRRSQPRLIQVHTPGCLSTSCHTGTAVSGTIKADHYIKRVGVFLKQY